MIQPSVINVWAVLVFDTIQKVGLCFGYRVICALPLPHFDVVGYCGGEFGVSVVM